MKKFAFVFTIFSQMSSALKSKVDPSDPCYMLRDTSGKKYDWGGEYGGGCSYTECIDRI